mgnify:CR=1 FL=1
MCVKRYKKVRVKIAADLSCNGKATWKPVKIDACISKLVNALQHSGLNMRGSCCGHGKREGYVHFQDGKILLILSRTESKRYMVHAEQFKLERAYSK